MLLRETIHKTKALFHRSLRKLKSFFLGGYQKLPRSLSFNPFNCNARTCTTSDQFYNEFYDILQSDLNSRNVHQIQSNSFPTTQAEPKNMPLGTTGSGRSNVSFEKQNQQKSIHEDRVVLKEKKKKDITKKKNEGGLVLAQRMKELEMMMESSDVEHELDIEEALHYYSRLTSPVYLDIVDKFFMDMHSEFSFPQSSVSIKHSKSKGRRLGSIRL